MEAAKLSAHRHSVNEILHILHVFWPQTPETGLSGFVIQNCRIQISALFAIPFRHLAWPSTILSRLNLISPGPSCCRHSASRLFHRPQLRSALARAIPGLWRNQPALDTVIDYLGKTITLVATTATSAASPSAAIGPNLPNGKAQPNVDGGGTAGTSAGSQATSARRVSQTSRARSRQDPSRNDEPCLGKTPNDLPCMSEIH